MKNLSYLLPLPKSYKENDTSFKIDEFTEILLHVKCSEADYQTAKLLQREIKNILSIKVHIRKVFSVSDSKNVICLFYNDHCVKHEEYILTVNDDVINISASSENGILYGAATLVQLIRLNLNVIHGVEINDYPDLKNRGYMLDITRGRMPSIDFIKSLVDRMALYKLNQLQLYMESYVRLEGLEEIWSRTDPITPQDILEIDSYCALKGIELVPCIATFGHMYDILRSKSYRHLSEMDTEVGEPYTWFHRMRYHIVNVSDPRSIELVKSILNNYLPLFRSKKVNICCDETFDLGKGKSKAMREQMGYGEMYFSYVNQLTDYLQDMGYEVMIWGDIAQNHPECIGALNKDVTCLNWFYYYNAKEEKFSIFKENNLKQYVCPSVSGFGRLINEYDMSYTNIKELVQLGMKYDAEGFLNTEWGDNGHCNMPAPDVPGIIYGASLSWNAKDDREFFQFDKAVSRVEYKDKSEKLVGLLKELSKQDLVILNDIMFIRDYKSLNLPYHVFGTCLYENAKKKIMETSTEELVKCANRANEIADELTSFAYLSLDEIDELRLCARGVALTQSLVLVLKHYEYSIEVKDVQDPHLLASQWEHWLYDYCKAWRRTSQESDISNIKKFFSDICKLLRSY